MRCSALLAGASFSALILTSTLVRADGYEPRYAGLPPFSWTGLYVGYQMGGAWGETRVSDPFGPSIFGDKINTPGPFVGGVVGYNWQSKATVFGLEADVNWADLDGTNTCFAFSGFFISANCRSHTNAFGTLTGRLGVVTGPSGSTMYYVKGGAAWEDNKLEATAGGGFFSPNPTTANASKWGWTVGGGVEHALGGNWSVKAEYDFLSFGNSTITTPVTGFQFAPPAPVVVLVPGVAASASQDIHEFKVGLNYRFGGPAGSVDDGWSRGSLKDRSLPSVPGTELEIGARYVHGWGRFQKDLGIQGLGINNLASRLTYDDMQTNGGELFARLDLKNTIMVKGFVGGGSGGGQLNDEDWGLFFFPPPIFIPYSNTVSDVDNRIRYGTIDVGYDWMYGRGYKVASFIGYNVLQQNMKAFGCTQIANPFSDCVPPIPTSVLAITEDDTWKSLRLGTSAEFLLIPRVKVSAEAAYLPWVWFDGTDNHVLRALVSPEDGHGHGVQLELGLSYAVTDQFNVGVMGRYWSMQTTTGETNFGGSGFIIPQKFAAEQTAITVGGSYKFSGN